VPFLLFLLAGVALLAVVAYAHRRSQDSRLAWTLSQPVQYSEAPPAAAAPPAQSMRTYLEGLRAIDPDFSLVLFEDFLYSLYAKVHEARGRGALDGLDGYVSKAARRGLIQGGNLAEIKAIVVASFEITGVIGLKKSTPEIRVAVAFTANYTEVDKDGTEQSYWVAEAWEVTRRRDAISPAPTQVRTFGCPSCGAPLDALQGNVCSYCKKPIDTGDSDWLVAAITETHREARGPQLTGETVEQGSDLETIIDAGAKVRLGDLSRRDPEFAFTAFQGRIEIIFAELQIAWSTRDWKRARPFVSDALFQSQLYWMTTYRKQKLRNVTERSRILGVQMAKLTTDKFFDAITVRVFASGLDYTVSDDSGEIVSGSKTRERYYTEYWTLIRGSSRTGKARAELTCPNCGGPLAVSMAGSCEHCNAKVTMGEFDWVLSRIEQDEAYGG
jgi:inner membrane protein import complex subunit Tim44-like protein